MGAQRWGVMTWRVAAIVALLSCPALAQAAGIQLRWDSCDGGPAASDSVRFDCNPSGGSVYSLYGTFLLDATAPGVSVMDGILDVSSTAPGLPPFWHFESTGCDSSGWTLVCARPAECSDDTAGLCGPDGSACQTVATFVPGVNGPGSTRLYFTVYRTDGAMLTGAPVRQFAMRLEFRMENVARCPGCTLPVSITWTQATLYSPTALRSPLSVVATLSATDPDSQATVTAGGDTVPVRSHTWGQLKALYR